MYINGLLLKAVIALMEYAILRENYKLRFLYKVVCLQSQESA